MTIAEVIKVFDGIGVANSQTLVVLGVINDLSAGNKVYLELSPNDIVGGVTIARLKAPINGAPK